MIEQNVVAKSCFNKKRWLFYCLICLFALILIFMTPVSRAESKALLIGVGDFENERVTDLPGLDLDIGIMTRLAINIGYQKSSIRALQDSEATIENIIGMLDGWLREGVTPEDSVLIYFTGHGSQGPDQDGDEEDQLDEYLLAYDYGVKGNIVSGVLVDDVFFQLLSRLPTENVMVVVDACHSGTGYRSFAGGMTGVKGGVAKFYIEAKEQRQVDASFASDDSRSSERFVAFMAADDTQTSMATNRGSVFTLGLEQAFKEAIASGIPTTPIQIIEKTREFVKAEYRSRPELIFTPQLGGDKDLIEKPMRLVAGQSMRDRVTAHASTDVGFDISTNKNSYPIGDISLRVMIDVPEEGYLNVVTVDPNDSAVVLFPNQFNQSNRVPAGKLTLPTKQMNFDIKANGPLGEHLIAAFWTPFPANMYTEGKGERSDTGEMLSVFSDLSEYTTRAFGSVAREQEPSHRGAWLTVEMVP